MTIRLGVIMDPLEKINYKKDSTLAMLWAASERGWDIHYLTSENIFYLNNKVGAITQKMQVFKNPARWATLSDPKRCVLSEFDVILIRKDPPFDTHFHHLTQLLTLAEQEGVLMVNRPQSLREANEKLFTLNFPVYCLPTIITARKALLAEFLQTQQDIVCKPLDGMGGQSIFRLRFPDENAAVVFEVLTAYETQAILAQRYEPAIVKGDKRILMIDGEPFPHVLARIPKAGELRGNLAAGGRGVAQVLSERDREIAAAVGPTLKEMGLMFVGLDVIGDWLTEINVTSPTCIRELYQQTGIDAATLLLDGIERGL